MKLTDEIRTGILIGLCLAGTDAAGITEKLFERLHRVWSHLPMDAIIDGELRDAIAKECGVELEQ